jgi:DNA-binding MarR family transcriptional regulator
MLKEVQIASTAQKNERFNNTEVRLMSEIVYAKSKGERLISTQLADRLALTRSAISQIVAKLEEEGVVRRVPDEIDKKIAYVELTEATEEKFGKVVDSYAEFIGQVVARFGVKKMDKMLSLVREFSEAVNDTVEICGCECKK